MLTLKFVPVWILNPFRIISWFSMSVVLFSWGSYILFWRMGFIKYACMQELTKSMSDHMCFVYHPLVGVEAELAIMLSGLILAYLILDLKFGSQNALKQGIAIIQWFFKHPAWMVPFIAASFYFYCDLSMNTLTFSVHPGVWIITFFAPAIALVAPRQKII